MDKCDDSYLKNYNNFGFCDIALNYYISPVLYAPTLKPFQFKFEILTSFEILKIAIGNRMILLYLKIENPPYVADNFM